MLRVARMYVSTEAVAEDVVQDAWVGVLKGLDGFEGRSSLRTWIFRILVNTAKTRGQREARSIPFSSVWRPTRGAVVGPGRSSGHRSALAEPRSGGSTPEERLSEGDARGLARDRSAAAEPARGDPDARRPRMASADVRNALESPRPISGCSCTAHAPRSARRSRAT